MKDSVRFEAPVEIWNVDMLEAAFMSEVGEQRRSVFAWLRKLTKGKQLLVVHESFFCRKAEDQPHAP